MAERPWEKKSIHSYHIGGLSERPGVQIATCASTPCLKSDQSHYYWVHVKNFKCNQLGMEIIDVSFVFMGQNENILL